MDKLNLKYTAIKVDEIEQVNKVPIENCIADTSISMIALFIQKGLIDDNGVHGVSKHVAMDTIDKYLEEHDKDELVLDIMEALINGGFLSRQVNIPMLRETMKKKMKEISKQMEL